MIKLLDNKRIKELNDLRALHQKETSQILGEHKIRLDNISIELQMAKEKEIKELKDGHAHEILKKDEEIKKIQSDVESRMVYFLIDQLQLL